MDKEDTLHMYSGILHRLKKNEILPFEATWMDLEIIILSEVSQSEKDICPCDLTYMWNLKQTNKETKLIDTGKRLVVASNRG